MLYLIALGVFVCIALSIYIFITLRRMAEVKKQRKAQEQALLNKTLEQREYLAESIRVIANAMIHDEKMTLSEGTIRISELLDRLAPELKQRQELRVIEEVHTLISDIPYLAEWKALSKQEQFKYKQRMLKVETKNKEALLEAAEYLKYFKLSNNLN